LRFIAPDRPEKVTERFDLPGAFLFMGGLICLLFGLNQGYALGWMSAPIIATFCSSVVLLGVFLYVERHSKFPMLDLQLFSNRQFSASVASAILNYLCVFTILFITPFYLIQARGYAASRAGLILTAMPLVMALVAALSGTLSDRIGTRTPALLGMIVLALGLYALSRLGENSPVIQIAVSLGIAGFGTGTFISPNTSALMGAAPRHRQGIAAGIMATSRNLGMVLGIGLSGAILTTYMSQSSIGQPPAMFEAIHLAFLVAAGFSILGSIITSLRANA